jgi:transposase
MIQIVPQLRIWLAYGAVDFRKGIDALVALCRQQLASSPDDGALYVFRNRRGSALRVLCYDGHGYWLCTRRFSRGTLRWWPKPQQQNTPLHSLEAQQLSVLLYNGLPDQASFVSAWRSVSPPQAARLSSLSADSSPR